MVIKSDDKNYESPVLIESGKIDYYDSSELKDRNIIKLNERYQIQIDSLWQTYIRNLQNNIKTTKSLMTLNNNAPLWGKNSIYVDRKVSFNSSLDNKNRVLEIKKADDLLRMNDRYLILGVPGIGKSTFLKYIFLDTVNSNKYKPIFLELRSIMRKQVTEISLSKFISSSMSMVEVDMPASYLEYSFKKGGYLFLFDGLDEISMNLSDKVVDAIERFTAEYPNNAYMITSRKNEVLLDTFQRITLLPLDLNRSIKLIERTGDEQEKKRAFSYQLKYSLYEKYKSVAQSPLLLNMMYLTYIRYGTIPNRSVDFYGICFEALYSRHDLYKGTYRRLFSCKELTEQQFKGIFAKFCFATYFTFKYEFEKNEILSLLEKFTRQFVEQPISVNDYLDDLQNVAGMLIKNGDYYQIVHRNFQAYFAAFYMDSMTDEKQRYMVNLLYSEKNIFAYVDFFEILYQLNPERFCENILLPTIEGLLDQIRLYDNCNMALLQTVYMGVSVVKTHGEKQMLLINDEYNKVSQVVSLFNWLILDKRNVYKKVGDKLNNLIKSVEVVKKSSNDYWDMYYFGALDVLGDNENYTSSVNYMYDEIIRMFEIDDLRKNLECWVEQQNIRKERFLESIDFHDLLDSLM